MRGRAPVRTCVGCGERAPQAVLLRFVARADRLEPARRAPGRGAYLHRRPECWTAFAGRRGPVRSLGLAPARAERERLIAALSAGRASGGER